MSAELRPLFAPASVALIGASANPAKLGNSVLRNLKRGNYMLIPVNPHEKTILGLKCVNSVSDLPMGIDLVLVLLPADAAVQAVKESVSRSAKIVAVASSGFGESGPIGVEMERRLLETIEGSSTRLLGPNTMGAFVPRSRLDTLFVSIERSRRPRSGPVAVVSQSGAVGVSCLERARRDGVGVSCFVGLGNKADIGENEVLDYLDHDGRTRCIAIYLESLKDGRGFCSLSKRIGMEKPIVLLKSGRSPSGQRAARSHTGAIATKEQVLDGALRQCGVFRAYDEEELVDTAKALEVVGSIGGDRICMVASAGGYGVIGADLIESSEHGAGMRMALMSRETQEALRRIVPEFSSIQNPIDLTAGVTDDMYQSVLRILQGDQGTDAILMSLELQPPNVSRKLVQVAAKACQSGRKPIVLGVFGGSRTDSILQELQKNRVLAYPTIWRAVRALKALSERGRYLARTK